MNVLEQGATYLMQRMNQNNGIKSAAWFVASLLGVFILSAVCIYLLLLSAQLLGLVLP